MNTRVHSAAACLTLLQIGGAGIAEPPVAMGPGKQTARAVTQLASESDAFLPGACGWIQAGRPAATSTPRALM
jgi:hypothetical protein